MGLLAVGHSHQVADCPLLVLVGFRLAVLVRGVAFHLAVFHHLDPFDGVDFADGLRLDFLLHFAVADLDSDLVRHLVVLEWL